MFLLALLPAAQVVVRRAHFRRKDAVRQVRHERIPLIRRSLRARMLPLRPRDMLVPPRSQAIALGRRALPKPASPRHGKATSDHYIRRLSPEPNARGRAPRNSAGTTADYALQCPLSSQPRVQRHFETIRKAVSNRAAAD